MSRPRILLLVLAFLSLPFAGTDSRMAYGKGGSHDLTILSSSSIQGDVAPCG